MCCFAVARRDPAGHARARQQIQRWLSTANRSGVRCVYGVQQLIYSKDGRPREKGIDAMAHRHTLGPAGYEHASRGKNV